MKTLKVTTLEASDLLRYVKPSHISNGNLKDEVFQLREDREPPEEYISFYHSKEQEIEAKILDVIAILKKKKFIMAKTSGFLHLDAVETQNQINLVRRIVEFREKGYPHYGMYYLSNDPVDILEAKSILMLYSTLYPNSAVSRLSENS